MSMTLKTTKNLCFGLSVVFKITTRRSTIDVRKKSDLSRKNRTTGPPGHVRKISDQPQPWSCVKTVAGTGVIILNIKTYHVLRAGFPESTVFDDCFDTLCPVRSNFHV